MMYDGNPTLGTTSFICAQPLTVFNTVHLEVKKQPPLKIKFSAEEDSKLLNLVQQYGTKNWVRISQMMETRNPRQCRERYNNYINPSLRKDNWKKEEDDLIEEKVLEFGPKWNKISKFFENRSDYSIRNRWMMLERHKAKSENMEKKLKANHFFKQNKKNFLPKNNFVYTRTFQNQYNTVIDQNQIPRTFINNNVTFHGNTSVIVDNSNNLPQNQKNLRNYYVVPIVMPDVKVAPVPKDGDVEPLFDLTQTVDETLLSEPSCNLWDSSFYEEDFLF